jgi:ubiquinone/menaquinone biosynthesis C-methylase UbiE
LERTRAYYDRSAKALELKKRACALDAEETDSILADIPAETHSMLDVGCGTGLLLHRVSCEVRLGIDLSISMLRLARLRDSGPLLILADARRLPMKDSRFDLVVSQDVIGHFRDDPGRMAEELARTCNPGGLIITTAARTTLTSRMVSIYSRLSLGVYVRSYTAGELEKILEVSGARVLAREVIRGSVLKLLATPTELSTGSR